MDKKKIIAIVVAVVIVLTGIFFVPRLCHTCDDCDKFFIGAGYEPNMVNDILSTEVIVLCKDCAEKQHAVSIAMGKSVDDFKRKIF